MFTSSFKRKMRANYLKAFTKNLFGVGKLRLKPLPQVPHKRSVASVSRPLKRELLRGDRIVI
jgi:hypothetical protein